MIFSHENMQYKQKWRESGLNKHNGAYYYSKEIVKNIIPNIETDRNWVTVNVPGCAFDHSIVFIHNNLHPGRYDWLGEFHDLILICGIPETCEKVRHLGKPIYLPLSVDVPYVEKFKTDFKFLDAAYVGRPSKKRGITFPGGISYLEGLPRDELLTKMARYKRIFAVGRTAIEAKILGCQILPYDPRFPDPNRWVVIDNTEAVDILQKKLDKVGG